MELNTESGIFYQRPQASVLESSSIADCTSEVRIVNPIIWILQVKLTTVGVINRVSKNANLHGRNRCVFKDVFGYMFIASVTVLSVCDGYKILSNQTAKRQ